MMSGIPGQRGGSRAAKSKVRRGVWCLSWNRVRDWEQGARIGACLTHSSHKRYAIGRDAFLIFIAAYSEICNYRLRAFIPEDSR